MSSYYIVNPPVVSTPTPVYDYNTVYQTIATELSNIDADTTPMAATLALIATSLSTRADKMTAIETYQKKMKELGEGTGIHIVGPYDWLGYSSLYKLYVEDDGAIGLDALISYKDKISNLPKLF